MFRAECDRGSPSVDCALRSSESFQRRVCRADDLRHPRTRAWNRLDRARDLTRKQRQAFEVARGGSKRRVGAELADGAPVLLSDRLAKHVFRVMPQKALSQLLRQTVGYDCLL